MEDQEEAVPLVSFTGPYFIACYVIISAVTALVMMWCFFNQILFPVQGSTVTVCVESSKDWTFTGYKNHVVGMTVYALVLITLVGIQFLLFLLTIFYYMQQEAITRWKPVFQDEVQVLKAFEIVWMVGFFWSFLFRYPSSIRDLFLRRCHLVSADYVAVMAPLKSLDSTDDLISGWGDKLTAAFCWPFELCLRGFFSYPNRKPGYRMVYCKVDTDDSTDTRGFYYCMRRFVYDEETNSFVPGTMEVGETLGDFLEQTHGLSSDEALRRFSRTGPNSIQMKKPTVLGCIGREFSKPFYLYQNFMVWTWFPYWYYYMAIINTFVRVSAGIVVGVFQYMSDSVLYQISHMEGQVT